MQLCYNYFPTFSLYFFTNLYRHFFFFYFLCCLSHYFLRRKERKKLRGRGRILPFIVFPCSCDEQQAPKYFPSQPVTCKIGVWIHCVSGRPSPPSRCLFFTHVRGLPFSHQGHRLCHPNFDLLLPCLPLQGV